jgi:hypothetical protein
MVNLPFSPFVHASPADYHRLDAIRSLSNPERLCFSPELRQTIMNLSNVKFELVNGCPRDLFLMMGNALEYSKLYSSGKIDYVRYKQLIEETRFRIYSWQLGDGFYPDVDSRWGFVAEAYRHACIIHTTRLLDEYMPVETPIIQASVTAILDSVSEIPTECYLLELLVLPLFIAGTECLSSHARHYVLLRLENIRAMAGVGNSLTNALLKCVWDARGNQAKNDHRNIPWMLFVSWSDFRYMIPANLSRPYQSATMTISYYDAGFLRANSIRKKNTVYIKTKIGTIMITCHPFLPSGWSRAPRI